MDQVHYVRNWCTCARHEPLGTVIVSYKVNKICMSRCRRTSNTVRTQVLSKAKSYHCLDNNNSILSYTLDWNYIVSNTLDRPLHRDWFSLSDPDVLHPLSKSEETTYLSPLQVWNKSFDLLAPWPQSSEFSTLTLPPSGKVTGILSMVAYAHLP